MIVVVIVPVLLIVPAMLVLVPPFVGLAPALFASFVQLVPGMIGFRTGRAVVLDCLVQAVVCVLDAVLALVLFVVCTRARHDGEAQQGYCYGQRRQQSGHPLRIACFRVIHANFSPWAQSSRDDDMNLRAAWRYGRFRNWSERNRETRLFMRDRDLLRGCHEGQRVRQDQNRILVYEFSNSTSGIGCVLRESVLSSATEKHARDERLLPGGGQSACDSSFLALTFSFFFQSLRRAYR
jgi:hypothetical protein